MSFPLIAVNPCICQTLWVCCFLDWIWFNCPELHHGVNTLPSVALENIQIWSAVMKSSLGLPLGTCSSKGSSWFSPCGTYTSSIPGGMLTAAREAYSSPVQFSSVITCAMVFLTQENLSIFPLRTLTDVLLGLLCVGVEVHSHTELFAQLDKDKSNEFISVQTKSELMCRDPTGEKQGHLAMAIPWSFKSLNPC